MKENASVEWLADIQTFQGSTSDVIQGLIAEKVSQDSLNFELLQHLSFC